ncbi:hypothetical protein [Paeniglutamicibacter kerguelensis]|uniref:Uncharacterized protein n=1 Tax=Paeniglutamicibacter kerguelensis TaxID=254788 RepID=A0ABS4XCB9_9MICC|nr:hypothetical protein [Paeniglutamicibacter kerguelensis]MBP2386110.1 hypothetical protein [Paeniglutamicibacter kerguelensis]
MTSFVFEMGSAAVNDCGQEHWPARLVAIRAQTARHLRLYIFMLIACTLAQTDLAFNSRIRAGRGEVHFPPQLPDGGNTSASKSAE